MLWTNERIYSGHLSYANLQQVVERKQWAGTDAFPILLATANCNDVSRWVWVITDEGVEAGLIVDCSNNWDNSLGLVADTNRVDLTHKWAWVIIR